MSEDFIGNVGGEVWGDDNLAGATIVVESSLYILNQYEDLQDRSKIGSQ